MPVGFLEELAARFADESLPDILQPIRELPWASLYPLSLPLPPCPRLPMPCHHHPHHRNCTQSHNDHRMRTWVRIMGHGQAVKNRCKYARVLPR